MGFVLCQVHLQLLVLVCCFSALKICSSEEEDQESKAAKNAAMSYRRQRTKERGCIRSRTDQ